jgi:formate dehydrogenase subunit gamma
MLGLLKLIEIKLESLHKLKGSIVLDIAHNIPKNHFEDWQPDLAASLLKDFDSEEHNLLDVLHFFQGTFGYIDKELIPLLAKFFNLSRAEVHGVISFYHDFRELKPASYVLKICQAESCQAMGCRKLTTELKAALDIDFHETSTEADITLEPVYCLGNCSCSPNLMINSQLFSRVTSESLKRILQRFKEAQHD